MTINHIGKNNVIKLRLLHHLTVGLRTLCIATTTVPPDFYETWKAVYYEASTAIQDREKKLEEAAELIEKVSDVI